MKIRFSSIIVLAGLFAGSCAVEDPSVVQGTICAVMEGTDTRTSVTDEGTFSWSAGDRIWLHTTKGGVDAILSSGAGTSSADFSYGSYFGDMTGVAVYPYNAGHSVSDDVLEVVLPASYDLGTRLTNTNAVMYGVNEGGTLKFSHLAGLMRFVFKNVPAGTDEFQITLDKKINGVFSADRTADHPVIQTQATNVVAEKTVVLNFTAMKTVSDISLYIPLPLGTYGTLDLVLRAGDQMVWSYSNTVKNTVSRKSLILMPTVNLGGTINSGFGGDVVDLSKEGTANAYIVSAAGAYDFKPTKGNSDDPVGAISSAEVLWETFGTAVVPTVGDLVKNVRYENGRIRFETQPTFREGNAVIAARDASGTILWSWHIWLTDHPESHQYYNGAGIMMDRNVGATSAVPGDAGALGLLYQWGRKDPFLGSSSISENIKAKSTLNRTPTVMSSPSSGTIEYAVANPATMITGNDADGDWYYTEDASVEDTRWTESDCSKSIYDPCPPGWRVPDGGSEGIWAKATGATSPTTSGKYDDNSKGENLSGKVGDASSIWYPSAGYCYGSVADLYEVGIRGYYWSASPNGKYALRLAFDYARGLHLLTDFYRACGHAVRCVLESSVVAPPVTDLSKEGTANSYIVSEAGMYKFTPTMGSSDKSVGAIASVEVLWESFGTDVAPNPGDLITNVTYKKGTIRFETPSTYHEGNAVIAAKGSDGNILWSWHIWLTDQPEGQEYYNNAGTVMDRNLGATSATPGEVSALGLLYQWGRKDPFPGPSSISKNVTSKSTHSPSYVNSNSKNGTIEYATANPTKFIDGNNINNDWYYTGDGTADNTRWTESDSPKSIYDPCPAGWRVPDGGSNGLWAKASGSSSSSTYYTYNSSKKGMNFSGELGSSSTIWYPAAGYYSVYGSSLVSYLGYFWSASPSDSLAFIMGISSDSRVYWKESMSRDSGRSVRCVQEKL